jgi:hypothetical protein
MQFALETYIKDISVCDDLIKFFHESRFSSMNRGPGTVYGSRGKVGKKSTDLSVFPSEQRQFPIIMRYLNQLISCADQYIAKFPWCNEYAPWGLTEGINIQWYKPGEGYYDWHTERCDANSPMRDRHLVWMTYLNDVENGGGTQFYHQNTTVGAKKGKTLIWPADWTYTHRGEVAPNEDKYIITGWFNYEITG